jgi:hypothetical protein
VYWLVKEQGIRREELLSPRTSPLASAPRTPTAIELLPKLMQFIPLVR